MKSFGQACKNEWHEAKDAGKELGHWARHDVQYKKLARGACQWKYWYWWLLTIVIVGLLAALSIERDKAVGAFEPHKAAIVNAPATWLIPIAVLIILSFPPLGGHEVILLIVGLIWGLGVGFAIACAGTFIGELACYLVFRFYATEKAKKVEEKSVYYACLARLMREGGLWILIIIRFSAVPGHVVTAIQSTVGVSWWLYSIAVIASLPKQFIFVYLGVMFGLTSGTGASPSDIKKQRRISLSVFFVTALLTVLALYIIYMRARKLYPQVLAERAEREQMRGLEDGDNAHASDPLRKEELANIIVAHEPSARPHRENSYSSLSTESATQREYEQARLNGAGNSFDLPPPQQWPGSQQEKAHPYSLQPAGGGSPQRSPRPGMGYTAETSDLGARPMQGTALRDGEGGDDWRAAGSRTAPGQDLYAQGGAGVPSDSFAEIPLTSVGNGGGSGGYRG